MTTFRSTIVEHKFLVAILIVAAVLRFWNLSNIPPSLTPDEASLGYNAYSILKTGRDEYGELMPVIFKSFGDYKPGLYVYLTVPFVALLGLNEWSVRLPSAFMGVLGVWILFLITKRMLSDLDKEFKWLPIASSLILAVSPWHIHFSRGAWEINLSLTLTLLGVYFFIKSFENSKYLLLSSVFFALTLTAYQGAKLATLLVLVSLCTVYFRPVVNLLKNKTNVFLSLLLGFIIALPIFLSFNGQTGRLTTFSIFSYPRPDSYLQSFLSKTNETKDSFVYFLFHSEALNFARGILGRWFNHFSGRFLFFEGDWQNPKHSIPYHGMLTLFDLALLLPGFYLLVRSLKNRPILFFSVWLLLAPLPAALSRDEIHAVRSYNMVIPLCFILGMGLVYLIKLMRSFTLKYLRSFSIIIFIMMYSFSYVYFLDMYFIHLAKHNTHIWDYGLREVVQTILPIQNNYQTIKVQQSFAQPYIYFLFYGADTDSVYGSANSPSIYDPKEYQKQATLSPSEYKNDVGLVNNIGNIYFTGINWPENRGEHGVLFAGDEARIPPTDSMDEREFIIHNDIFYPDGRRAFRVVEVK